jgi:hypothetical protein
MEVVVGKLIHEVCHDEEKTGDPYRKPDDVYQ